MICIIYLFIVVALVLAVTVTELHSSTMFSEESCSVDLSEKMGFSLDRNCRRLLCGERRSGGSAFQTTGAAMEKLHWPMDVFALETNRLARPAERSGRLAFDLLGRIGWPLIERYAASQ